MTFILCTRITPLLNQECKNLTILEFNYKFNILAWRASYKTSAFNNKKKVVKKESNLILVRLNKYKIKNKISLLKDNSQWQMNKFRLLLGRISTVGVVMLCLRILPWLNFLPCLSSPSHFQYCVTRALVSSAGSGKVRTNLTFPLPVLCY